MTGREILRRLRRLGCEIVRQRGSHVRVRCGACQTTVPAHRGQDLPPGTLRSIERDLEPLSREGMVEVTYRVEVKRDEDGAWIARVPHVPGCHTYGRTLAQVRW